jgi:uncharacterized protein with von Willebrand factor type A (vWA) domain
VADLQLSALTRGSPETTLQLLRTALWHADRLIDRHEAQARSEAILEMAQAFRAEWAVERADWEEAQALLQSMGEGEHLHWDALKGHLRSRAWHEARRLAALMAQRPELAALLRRVGRMQRPLTAVHHPPAPRDAVSGPQPAAGLKPVETVLPDAPGELRGIRLGDRLERLLGSELQHPAHGEPTAGARPPAHLPGYIGLHAGRTRVHRQGGGAGSNPGGPAGAPRVRRHGLRWA